jgi:asparagine synthase (glutamine-hydrolysing)
MCGIVGAIETRSAVDPEVLAALNRSMKHRGPDGDGFFFSSCHRLGMAMRRLAIIDPEGGQQPLFTENRQIAVMQNGEIYNHCELRGQLEARGHVFRTRSDTEVLAHGFEEWGLSGLLDRLDGMFAFAIADIGRQKLYLARDRFGEKPLYYHAAPGRFAYASQMLTLAAYPGVDSSWDFEGLNSYLALHYVPGDRTVLRDIRKLRPGHVVTVDWQAGRHHVECYWRLTETDERSRQPEEIREQLERSVRSRLIADVPVGIFLSGGLDSSLLAALALRSLPRIATFSMGFAECSHDERPYAQQVSDYLGTTHHHLVFDGDSFEELLPRVVADMDEPIGDQAMLPLYWLCEVAAQEVKVVLSGEGADELFAGYSYFNSVSSSTRQRGWRGWLRAVYRRGRNCPNGTTESGFPLLSCQHERNMWLGNTSKANGRLRLGKSNCHDPLRRACLADVESWLAEDLLMKLDKMAMAHGLEGRAPYLAASLAEMAFSLPHRQKIDGNRNKTILRDAAASLLPPDIVERPKQGFVLPMRRWLSDYLGLEVVKDLIPFAGLGIDPQPLISLLESEVRNGILRERLTYAVVVLAKWAAHARGYIERLRRTGSRIECAAA